MRDRDHLHCPYEHEHPQPFHAVSVDDNWDDTPVYRWYCGACWHRDGELTEMVPCTPELCPDDFE